MLKKFKIIIQYEQEMWSKQPISFARQKSKISKLYSFPLHDFYFILLYLNPFRVHGLKEHPFGSCSI